MNKIIILIIFMAFTPCAHAKGTNITIQIIMDDSGVLINPSEADQYKMQFLLHIKRLVRKRKFSTAHIDVISSSIGRTVWSGTPSDLKRKAARALALVNAVKSIPQNCNNLSGAFNELASNLRALKRQGYRAAHVIVFSSLIHTPRPCTKTTKITLPQLPPVKGNINKALTSFKGIRSIDFYWVSPHQMLGWEEFLSPTLLWADQHDTRFNLRDIERSKFSLQRALKLEAPK